MTIYVANASISYTPPTSPVVQFSEKTGRPIRTFDGGIEQVILLSLEQRDTKSHVFKKSGKEISGAFCTGRILPIKTPIPDWLTADSEFPIEWNDGRSGIAYILSSVTSRYNLQQVFGERIQLYFVQKSQNN